VFPTFCNTAQRKAAAATTTFSSDAMACILFFAEPHHSAVLQPSVDKCSSYQLSLPLTLWKNMSLLFACAVPQEVQLIVVACMIAYCECVKSMQHFFVA